MWRKMIILVFSAVLFLWAGEAEAQGIGLGPQVGYQKASDADEGRLMAGAALRIKLTRSFGVEGSINYRQEKYADGALTVRNWPIMATGLLYILPIVYGAAGAGWYNTTFDYDEEKLGNAGFEDKTTQEFGLHFGGGVELPLGSVTLTGDIRYVLLNYDTEQIPGTGDVAANFYMITVGLLFGL